MKSNLIVIGIFLFLNSLECDGQEDKKTQVARLKKKIELITKELENAKKELMRLEGWDRNIAKLPAKWSKIKWNTDSLERKFVIEKVEYRGDKDQIRFVMRAKRNYGYEESRSIRLRALDELGKDVFPIAGRLNWFDLTHEKNKLCYLDITGIHYLMFDIRGRECAVLKFWDSREE